MFLALLNEKIKPLTARALSPADYDELFLLHKGNVYYNACLSGGAVAPPAPLTKEQVLAGLAERPPDVRAEQKLYLGVFGQGGLLACLDCLLGYPDKGTLFLGLLMVDARRHRQGVGAALTRALIAAARGAGYQKIRLACLTSNAPALLFWAKQGFREAARKTTADGRAVIVMEILLS